MAAEPQNSWIRPESIAKLRSPEHQALCGHYAGECTRLEAIASRLYPQLEQIQSLYEEKTVRREFCSQSRYMHRGYYCPSPVFDLIIGNVKRGKILKRITSRSKPTHEYGFDADGRILWCKSFSDRKQTSTEYLFYEADSIYGITLDSTGSVQHISEEIYRDRKIIQYSHCLTLQLNGTTSCIELHREEFEYDSEVLSLSRWTRFLRTPESVILAPFLDCLPQGICTTETYQILLRES